MESRLTVHGQGEKVEGKGLSNKEKGLVDMDNSMVAAAGRGWV